MKNGDDLPVVVLGEYGQERTAFLSYNLIESALNGDRSEHLALLRKAAWRYFVRFADRRGEYVKTTAALLGLEAGYVPFADYPADFSVGDDSCSLLLKALTWVDGQLPAHPEAVEALQAIRDEMERIGTLQGTTSAESETVIHESVQTLHQALQFGIDSGGLRKLLDQYLRVVEGEGYFN